MGVNPQNGLQRGTLLVMAGEALSFPAGLAATVLLTRHFTTADYGALALALAGTAWLEWTVVSLFSRACWKLVAEATDWRAAVPAVVRTMFIAGALTGVVLFATAGGIAGFLRAPQFAPVLRVLAFEIPAFALAQAYRAVLIGRGLHGSRATVAAIRWTVRALLIAAGILLNASLAGIAAAIVAASIVESLVARWRALRPGDEPVGKVVVHAQRSVLTVRQLVAYAGPLALSAICIRLFDRLDIFALRSLNGSLESVAAYGVAQNLALAPALFGGAFNPMVIAALSYRLARGDAAGARQLASNSLRVCFLTLPLALLLGGAAPALVHVLFGQHYDAAAPLFALLVVAAVGSLVIAIGCGILVAAGRLMWTLVLTAPLLLVALIGYLIFVPSYGAIGAASVTAGCALLGAAATCIAAQALAHTPLPLGTLLRSIVFGGAAAWAGSALHVRDIALLPALALITIALAIGICLSGELRPAERNRLMRWAQSLRQPAEARGL